MECTTCVPPSGRRDKPHTFFAHELTTCPGCGAALEGRVVLRDGGVVHAHTLPGLWPDRGADRGRRPGLGRRRSSPAATSRRTRPATTSSSTTTSTCPTCLALTPGRRRDSRRPRLLQEACPTCGPSEALVSEDAGYYVRAYALRARRHRAAEVRRPRRARLPDRLRHLRRPRAAHLPADHRDHRPLQPRVPDLHRRQPVLAPHGARDLRAHRRHAGRQRRPVRVDRAVGRRADQPPAAPRADRHRRSRAEIGRVVMITNGLRLGRDRAFAEALKAQGRLRRRCSSTASPPTRTRRSAAAT